VPLERLRFVEDWSVKACLEAVAVFDTVGSVEGGMDGNESCNVLDVGVVDIGGYEWLLATRKLNS